MPAHSILLRCLLAALLTCAQAARADLVSDIHALMDKGKLADALSRSEAALAASPRDAQSLFLRAFVLMELQRNAEALAAFVQLSQEYPELPEPFNNIALLHARDGRLELARQALESALRNDPGHRAARINLGEVHLRLAVQAWEHVAGNTPLEARLASRLEAARALIAATTAVRR